MGNQQHPCIWSIDACFHQCIFCSCEGSQFTHPKARAFPLHFMPQFENMAHQLYPTVPTYLTYLLGLSSCPMYSVFPCPPLWGNHAKHVKEMSQQNELSVILHQTFLKWWAKSQVSALGRNSSPIPPYSWTSECPCRPHLWAKGCQELRNNNIIYIYIYKRMGKYGNIWEHKWTSQNLAVHTSRGASTAEKVWSNPGLSTGQRAGWWFQPIQSSLLS